jgi:hypothetical protein
MHCRGHQCSEHYAVLLRKRGSHHQVQAISLQSASGRMQDRQAAYVCTNGAACCTEFARPQHNQPNPADRGYRELGCMKGGDWYLHKGGHEEGVVGTDAQVAAPRGGICWVEVI